MRVLNWMVGAFAVAFGAAALTALTLDVLDLGARTAWLGVFRPLGLAWSEIEPNSLALLAPALDRHVAPLIGYPDDASLYVDLIQPALLAPAAPTLGAAAIVFTALWAASAPRRRTR